MKVLWHCERCDTQTITSEPLLNQRMLRCETCGEEMEVIDEQYSVHKTKLRPPPEEGACGAHVPVYHLANVHDGIYGHH